MHLMVKNRYGLNRNIPNSIKIEVRKRCGFGCIECGSAIYQYHHYDPPFEDAKTHDPNGITLLCGTCHDKAHRRLLSKKRVSQCNDSLKCLSAGFSHFTLGLENPEIILGAMTVIGTPNIIVGFGQPLLVIEPPEDQSAPFRLSAIFQDKFGKEIARIVQNEWRGSSDNWDIRTEGPKFTIRQAPHSIDLGICIAPNKLIIEKLNMFYKGYRINCEKNQTTLFLPDGSIWFTALPGNTIAGCTYGIVFG